MIGASFAAVPFYNWFCKTTGFAGTTQVSEKAPDQILGRTLIIRFDSNVAPGLPWTFVPEQNEIKVRIGEVATVHYKVINEAARTVTAQASYNVSPPTIGGYFNKINCFCFTEQTMKPGETREMTVVFYVDPSIAKDHDQDDLNTITLSYTFYRLPDSVRPVAEAPDTKSNKL
jgi:cytochrome c oxidase assembly protein subunit 11